MSTILIVDDDPVSVQLIELILRSSSHTTASAPSAAAAIAWLDEGHSVDAVITDHNLGGTTGLELYLMLGIHLRYRCLPVVLCTGAADPRTVAEALELGVRYFIVKPITPKVLLDKVETAVMERPSVWVRGHHQCPACGSPLSRRA